MSRGASYRCRSASRGGRWRFGFTLIEVVSVLALLGAVFSAAIWLIMQNARFYDRSGESIEARENLRAALDLLATEIRQASPADLLAAASDSLAVRFNLSRAIVCDSTAVDEVALVVFDTVRAPNVPSGVRGTAISEPYDTTFIFHDGWQPPLTRKGSVPRAICSALGTATDLPSSRFRVMRGWRSQYGKLPPKGSFVRFYGKSSYGLRASSFDLGLAVRRNGQELASPFAEGSSFSYVLEGGVERSAVPVEAFGRIRAVRIRLEALGRSGGSRFQPPVRLVAEHLVFLRN